MTLADQAAIAGHDGQVTSGKPEGPKSRTFTREFKAKIVAEIGALQHLPVERIAAELRQQPLKRVLNPPLGLDRNRALSREPSHVRLPLRRTSSPRIRWRSRLESYGRKSVKQFDSDQNTRPVPRDGTPGRGTRAPEAEEEQPGTRRSQSMPM